MSTTIANVSAGMVRSVDTITGEIRYIANRAAQDAYTAMVEMGKRLEEVKAILPAGEWGSYCERELPFSQRTASNYMKIYRDRQENPNSQAFANLDYAKIVRLLSVPAEEREQLLQEQNVADLSARELDKVIKERDEARVGKESSEAKVRDLEQQLLDIQQQAAAAKSDEAAWQEQIEKLNAARDKAVTDAEKAKQKLKELKENPKIPQSVMDKLAGEAAQKATKDAHAEYEAKLAEAQKKADVAEAAAAAAERDAQDARQQLANARNAARVSSPEAAAFSVLYPQIKESFNRLNGCRMKIAVGDPELGEKLLELMRQLVGEFQKAVGS